MSVTALGSCLVVLGGFVFGFVLCSFSTHWESTSVWMKTTWKMTAAFWVGRSLASDTGRSKGENTELASLFFTYANYWLHLLKFSSSP